MSAAHILALFAAVLAVAACDQKVGMPARDDPSNVGAMTAQPFQDRRVTNPFPQATQLRLFVEIDDTKGNKPILSKPNGVLLSPAQRTAFEDSLVMTAAPEYAVACFIPHHYFRYYDPSGKEIGTVAVCFYCDGVEASGSKKLEAPAGAMLSADYRQLKKLVAALGEPTDVLCD